MRMVSDPHEPYLWLILPMAPVSQSRPGFCHIYPMERNVSSRFPFLLPAAVKRQKIRGCDMNPFQVPIGDGKKVNFLTVLVSVRLHWRTGDGESRTAGFLPTTTS